MSKPCSWAFRSRMLVFIYLFVLCAKTIISCCAGCQAKNQKALRNSLSYHRTPLVSPSKKCAHKALNCRVQLIINPVNKTPRSCETLFWCFFLFFLSAWEENTGACRVPRPCAGTGASLLLSGTSEAVQHLMDGHGEEVMKRGMAI